LAETLSVAFFVYLQQFGRQQEARIWFTSVDELEEVDIGPGDKPRPTFISNKLDPSLREPMIALLKEYSDCFAWDYMEMPGLDKTIVEQRLPLKKYFGHFSNERVK
jgi:hypothetical protein